MKLTTFAISAISAVSSVSALTYNATLLDQTNPDDYRCLTTEEFNSRLPECIRHCQIRANREDRCAYNDYACHCANYDEYASIIEPCALPAEIVPGGEGACGIAELQGQIQPLVTQMCNYFNATQYDSYKKCDSGKWGIQTSPLVYLDVIANALTEVYY